MSIMSEVSGRALAEHRDRERETLERVTAEALSPERLPEGQEPRNSTVIVDGEAIPEPTRRIHGKLTVRW